MSTIKDPRLNRLSALLDKLKDKIKGQKHR